MERVTQESKAANYAVDKPRENTTFDRNAKCSPAEEEQTSLWRDVLNGYLSEKAILTILGGITSELMSMPELPVNPYVFVCNRLRLYEHNFAIFEDFASLHSQLVVAEPETNTHKVVTSGIPINPIQTSEDDTGVTCPQGEPNIWGWPHVLRVVNVDALSTLWKHMSTSDYLLNSGTRTEGDYEIRDIPSLCGPVVLYGRILPFFPLNTHISHDCIIRGPNFERAVKMFANVLMRESIALEQSDLAVVTGVFIETPPRSVKAGGTSGHGAAAAHTSVNDENMNVQLWTVQRMRESKHSFIRTVKTAVVAKRKVYMELYARVAFDRHTRHSENEQGYVSAGETETKEGLQGTDGLNVLSGSNDVKRSRRRSIDSTMTVKTFDDELHAESPYICIEKTFVLHFILVKRSKDTTLGGEKSTSPTKGAKKKNTTRGKDEDKETPAIIKTNHVRSFGSVTGGSLAHGVFGSKQDALDYAELLRTPNGSMLQLQSTDLQPFKETLKRKVLQALHVGDLINTCIHLCALCLWAKVDHVLDDLVRLFRSQAGALHSLVNTITTIQNVTRIISDNAGERSIAYQTVHFNAAHYQFAKLDMSARELFSVQDCTEVIVLRGFVFDLLSKAMDPDTRKLRTNEVGRRALRQLEEGIEALEDTIAKDILTLLCTEERKKTQSNTILSLLDALATQARERAQENVTAQEQQKVNKSSNTTSKHHFLWGRNKHGSTAGRAALAGDAKNVRTIATNRAREDQLIINIKAEAKRALRTMRFPAQVATEASRMQYLVDTRLDIVMHSLLMQIVLSSSLTPNPIPALVARVRTEAVRHSLWVEKDEELIKHYAPRKSVMRCVHRQTFTYAASTTQPKTAAPAVNINSSQIFNVDTPTRLAESINFSAASANQKHLREGGRAGVFGSRAAAQLAHIPTISPLLRVVNTLIKNTTPVPAGHATFSEDICIGLTGDELLLSHVREYETLGECLRNLRVLNVFEAYVIKGARLQGAIALFAEHVVEYALHLHDRTQNLVLGLRTGREALWTLRDELVGGSDGGWWESDGALFPSSKDKNDHDGDTSYDGGDSANINNNNNSNNAHSGVKRNKRAGYSNKDAEGGIDLSAVNHARGKTFNMTELRREKEACMREVIRAVGAHEPIVLLVAFVLPTPELATQLGATSPRAKYVLTVKHLAMFFELVPSCRIQSMLPPYCKADYLYRCVWPSLDQAKLGVSVINSATDPANGTRNTVDPDDPNNQLFQMYANTLKSRVAKSARRGNYNSACRSLLWLNVLGEDGMLERRRLRSLTVEARAVSADLIRMLKPYGVAQALCEGQVMAAAVWEILRARADNDDLRAKVNSKLLNELVFECRQSLEATIASPRCVYLSGVSVTVHALLLSIGALVKQDKSGKETRHLDQLHDLRTVIECVKTSASTATVACAPDIVAKCKLWENALLDAPPVLALM